MFKGGLEEEASVHAMNFNLLLALILPSLSSPPQGRGRDDTSYLWVLVISSH